MYVQVHFKSGRSFEKIVDDEKCLFAERVDGYRESILRRGTLKTGAPYFVKKLRYKPLIETDSPFSIVADNVLHEAVGFLDVSEHFVILIALTSENEWVLKTNTP